MGEDGTDEGTCMWCVLWLGNKVVVCLEMEAFLMLHYFLFRNEENHTVSR